jgi:hypothetical protein
MKRSPLTRKTPWRPERKARSCALGASPMPLSSLKRTAFKRKARRAQPGDDAARLAFCRRLPCVVGPRFGRCRRRIDPHHMTGGKGAQKRGKSQKVSDRNTLPLCRRHHDDFHAGRGIFLGWTDEQRRVFQEDEIERLNRVYDEWKETGVFVEPLREAV